MSKNKNLHEIQTDEYGVVSIGNYTNVTQTNSLDKTGHRLYTATCKSCGEIIIKKLGDIRRMSLKCKHKHSGLVYGVGVNDMPVGWVSESSLHLRIYDIWRHMLLRTTSQYWQQYPTYEGTSVCDEWHYLSKFYNDIQLCDGYEYWKENPNQRIMLDKDTKIQNNKHYSKDTCRFISHADSNRDVNKRHPESQLKAAHANKKYGISIKAINVLTNEFRIFPSKQEAGRELDILPANIWMILSDDEKYKQNKTARSKDGSIWTFELNNGIQV